MPKNAKLWQTVHGHSFEGDVSQGKEIQKHSIGLVKNDYAVHNSKDILFSNQVRTVTRA